MMQKQLNSAFAVFISIFENLSKKLFSRSKLLLKVKRLYWSSFSSSPLASCLIQNKIKNLGKEKELYLQKLNTELIRGQHKKNSGKNGIKLIA